MSAEKIRLALADDQAAIVVCVEAAYERYIERMGMRPAPMLADYEALIAAGAVWVLSAPAGIVGVLVIMPQGDCLFIENVAVVPGYQGRGYGRRLMEFAEQAAVEAGLPCLSLYTNELMTENLGYYQALGFREIERRTEHGYRRVYMQKNLATSTERTDDRIRRA